MSGTAANTVIAEFAGQSALGAQHLAVQIVAFDIGDRRIVDPHLVDMSRAVVRPVDRAFTRDRRVDPVAELVVAVRKPSGRRVLLEQLAAWSVSIYICVS